MHTFRVRNVNEAYPLATNLLIKHGELISPRGQETLELPMPLATVYSDPMERVCLIRERDANPFFHLFESLWILAGRRDVAFLTKFNSRMSDYSDNGTNFHGAYGHRLKVHLGFDQIEQAIISLIRDPDTRQVVLQIWDANKDLGNLFTRDLPCNDLIFLKIRAGRLKMTVCNRSNDMIWGAYGANAVQFSMLQEYIAGRVDVGIGTLTQVSDSFHVYTGNPQWERIKNLPYSDFNPYKYDVKPMPIMDEPSVWDEDLYAFLNIIDTNASVEQMPDFYNSWFAHTAMPMYRTWIEHKEANNGLSVVGDIEAEDWRMAAIQWLEERE